MTDKSWLNKLKPGDKVIVDGRYHKFIESVKRVTKTMIILSSDARFKRSSGIETPYDAWNIRSLIQVTPERMAKIEETHHRSMLFSKIPSASLRKLPTDQLEQIVKWIDAQKEE